MTRITQIIGHERLPINPGTRMPMYGLAWAHEKGVKCQVTGFELPSPKWIRARRKNAAMFLRWRKSLHDPKTGVITMP